METWLILTHWGARLVLVALAGLSIWSVAIMVDRRRALSAARAHGRDGADEARKLIVARDWDGLKSWATRHEDLPAGMLRTAIGVDGRDQVELAVKSYLLVERTRLERGFTVLATLGSNAPFIGLFGTVLGIIQAFGALSSQQGAMGSVMSGISEALVATAVGLFVAIPAVVAYNTFARRLREILVECESLRDLYLSRR